MFVVVDAVLWAYLVKTNLYFTSGMTFDSMSVRDWCQTELSKLLQTEVEQEMVE